MRRSILAASPIALLASACTFRPWTPAVSVEYYPSQPAIRNQWFPARGDALRRWQLLPEDPWAPYAKYTLLSALDATSTEVDLQDVTTLAVVQQAETVARQIAAAGLPDDTMWIVDMRGAASVAFGVALSQTAREPVTLVPTFNNWPAVDELVPAEETLAALATMTPRLPEDDPQGQQPAGNPRPVFLLDSWRLAYRDDPVGSSTYDNRYILSPSDLPDAETLRQRGIRRIVYLVQDLGDVTEEEDDLHASFLDWQNAGISIAMMDLVRLERPVLASAWGALLVDCAMAVRPRKTLLNNEGFFKRARGGFGGARAWGSPVRVGGAWAGHGGHGGHGGGG